MTYPKIKNSLHTEFQIIGNIQGNTGSSSDMYVLEHKKTGNEYFLKLVVKKTDRGDSPEYYFLFQNECLIYKYLKSELIDKYHARNILPLEKIGNLSYEQWFRLVRNSPLSPDLSDNQIDRNLLLITEFMIEERETRQQIDTPRAPRPSGIIKNIDLFRYSYLMTPLIESDYPNFAKLLRELSIQEICKYMSVLFFTVYQMIKVGVNHNDLHFGNILVRNFQPQDFQSKSYLIATPKTTFIIDLPYTLLIFDFDRSVIKNKHNIYLEDYAVLGNCPDFHPRRDILKLICGLYRNIKWLMMNETVSIDHSEITEFLEHMLYHLIPDEYIRAKIHETSNCFLEMDDIALGCRDEYLDLGVSDIGKTLGFFLQQSKFIRISTIDLINNEPVALEIVSRKMIRDFTNRFTLKKSNLDRFVKNNIQYTELFKGRQKLVKNIRNFMAMHIQ